MRLPGVKLAQRSFRKARSRLLGGAVVLGYHRVGATGDPFGLAVSPQRFAAQMEILARCAQPMRLSDAVGALVRGTLPKRAVVVTFDDGYRDTFETALPVLERAGVPATVFVTTGHPGLEFWWDELARIVGDSATLAESLTIDIGGRMRFWQVRSDGGSSGALARRALVTSIANALRALRPIERDRAMRMVRAWTGGGCENNEGGYPRALTVGELRHLATSRCIEIGAHTVSHPVLTDLSPEEQCDEVVRSRSELQRLLGAPVTSFSYPHGAHSAETRSIVAEAGFTVACGSRPDVLRRAADTFAVPRLWVGDQDGDSFTEWLDGWLQRSPR